MIPSLVPNRFNGLNSHWVFLLWAALCTCSITKVAAAPPSLTPQQRQRYENDLARWKGLLNEYHQGKRDENDGGAILFNLLHDYGVLGSSTTAEAVEAVNEWHALLKKHPEFKTQVPELHEEIAEAEARKNAQKELEQKAATFTPKDSRYFDVLGHDDKMALVYQFHVEFFKLPSGMKLERDQYSSFHINTGDRIVRGGKGIAGLGLKPLKSVWFRHLIRASRDAPWRVKFNKFIFICEDLLGGYSGADEEESKLLWAKYPESNGTIQWVNKSADLQDFCGAFSFDGRVAFQLPTKQHLPDTWVELGRTSPDGSTIELQVGQLVESTVTAEDDAEDVPVGTRVQNFGNVRQVLFYTFPDKLETYDVKDGLQIAAARKAHGF